MSIISNNSFKSVVVGTDPVSKGTFSITYAFMILDYNERYEIDSSSRAKGEIIISGKDNPLFQIGKDNPLRLQGLVASVMFGTEKRFIRFVTTNHYLLHDDELFSTIELDVMFDILDNLEYVENINEYKDNNLL